MSVFHAIILGIVQGLTEFLPVSSSAHLIIVPWLLGWEEPGLSFDAALHLGTLLATIVYFWRELWAMLRAVPIALRHPVALARDPSPGSSQRDDPDARLLIMIAIATIPGAFAGFVGQSAIDDFFHGSHHDRAIVLIAVALASLALLLLAAERMAAQQRGLQHLTWRDAIKIGLSQAVALIPGVSRSGATITTGLFQGLRRADAARFSFLLGIPLIAGAGAKSLLDVIRDGMSGDEVTAFVVGIAVSAVVGFCAISGLLRFLQRQTTMVFITYRVVLAIGLIVLVLSGFR